MYNVPFARPYAGEEEANAVREVVMSGWVTQGPQVAAFESEFAATVGASHACAVSNCTTALHLALMSVGVQSGDEVVTVSHSFIATANVVRYCGAFPVFVDIDPRTFNIDPALIEAAITSKTRALLVAHQMGMPCDMAAIMTIAHRYGLPVVEDAACGLGAEIMYKGQWQRIGAPIGDVVCFSFHPRKIITTGDGGMITTNDPQKDRQFRLWRQHGMSASDMARNSSTQVMIESYPVLGYNYRLTDIQAAMGRQQLIRLDEIVEKRRTMGAYYQKRLAEIPGVVAPAEPAWARANWQSYCVRLPPERQQIPVMQSMLNQGIATRRGVMCAHLTEAYEGWDIRFPLPQSEAGQNECILLPCFTGLTQQEQDAVVAALAYACRA